MLTRRLVVCLDVDGGQIVKGTRFRALRAMGDPVARAEQYATDGADEITLLDVSATTQSRGTTLDVVQRVAERLFIPLTVGGGIRSVDDVGTVLRSGADKVGINSAAVVRPQLLTEAADRFGRQCIVASIDAQRAPEAAAARSGNRWQVIIHGGRTATTLDPIAWGVECVRHGAGELLVTSIDADGTRRGYDLELTRAMSAAVDVPVVASGGAGTAADICDVLITGGADAALVAGIVHDGTCTIGTLKTAMRMAGLPVRRAGAGRDACRSDGWAL